MMDIKISPFPSKGNYEIQYVEKRQEYFTITSMCDGQ